MARAAMLLKAVVEAIYNTPKAPMTTPARIVAFKGALRVGWTLAKNFE